MISHVPSGASTAPLAHSSWSRPQPISQTPPSTSPMATKACASDDIIANPISGHSLIRAATP